MAGTQTPPRERIAPPEPQAVTGSKPPQSGSGIALAIISIAQLMIILDATIVNVALPTIQRELGFTTVDLQWIINGYSITFGGLLLLGGRFGDIFGRRRMFMIGLIVFTVSSLLAGVAQSEAWLIIARIIQGLGAAIVTPTALSLLTDTFPEGPSRDRAFGVYGAIAGAGGSLGLLLGGVLTDLASWRWIFFINLFIGAALLVLIPRIVKGSRPIPGHMDLAGGLTVTAGLMSLIYGLTRAGNNSFSDVQAIVFIVLAFVLLAVFWIIERRSRYALMPFRIFSNRNRSGAYAVSLTIGAALFGVFFFLTLYVQNILGFSPLRSGVAFLPLSIGITIMSIVISRFIRKTGPRLPMAIGALIAAGGLYWMSLITPTSEYFFSVFGPALTMAVGLGLLFVPMTLSAVSGVRPHEAGLASALLNAGQQVGGAIGLGVLVNVSTSATASQLAAGANQASALVSGYSNAFVVSAGIAFLAFIIALIAVRTPRIKSAPIAGGPPQ
jgi:EmrB/QacA subfamily drug resistance transporter